MRKHKNQKEKPKTVKNKVIALRKVVRIMTGYHTHVVYAVWAWEITHANITNVENGAT